MEDSGIRLLREYIGSVVAESMRRMLYENSVILSGGTGYGKGFVLNRKLPVSGNVMNVDNYKTLHVQGVNRKRINDPRVYDLKYSPDVAAVHVKV